MSQLEDLLTIGNGASNLLDAKTGRLERIVRCYVMKVGYVTRSSSQ